METRQQLQLAVKILTSSVTGVLKLMKFSLMEMNVSTVRVCCGG